MDDTIPRSAGWCHGAFFFLARFSLRSRCISGLIILLVESKMNWNWNSRCIGTPGRKQSVGVAREGEKDCFECRAANPEVPGERKREREGRRECCLLPAETKTLPHARCSQQ